MARTRTPKQREEARQTPREMIKDIGDNVLNGVIPGRLTRRLNESHGDIRYLYPNRLESLTVRGLSYAIPSAAMTAAAIELYKLIGNYFN